MTTAGQKPSPPSQNTPSSPNGGGPTIKDRFRRFANAVSHALGNPWAFVLALLTIFVWGITGPIFNFSDTWQLIINTGTTIVTFLMVFLVQNTQNRDGKAIQLKLDELIRALKGARNDLVNLECLTDDELDRLQTQFENLRQRSGNSKAQKSIEETQEKVKAMRDLDLAAEQK